MASTIKVNNIQNQCGANIANKCGTTITLGASGDTITLACGASQTGFGRTGTVDWDTTAKTASFTAVSGNGYFVNTTSGAITLTLPASPSGGDIVSVKDYAQTFDTNNLTIGRNSSPINGANASDPVISTKGASITFIYVDGTQGWVPTQDDQSSIAGIQPYVIATGGTVTTCGDYKIHTFTSPGTFCVTSAGTPAGSNTVDYLVVGGGGGGGSVDGGGGGAGGYRESSGAASGCYSASPLGACVSALPVTAQGYPITVGAGGAGTASPSPNTGGNRGGISTFSTITAAGGGGGAGGNACSSPYTPGGSGGGGRRDGNGQGGGTGNVPIVSPPQGRDGGTPSSFPGPSAWEGAAGGGGATTNGTGGTGGSPSTERAGNGGAGATSSINGTPTARAGGGGGGAEGISPNCFGTGGTGGGGDGFNPGRSNAAGTVNTGGGGGGRGNPGTGSTGGSGIVIIRDKFQ